MYFQVGMSSELVIIQSYSCLVAEQAIKVNKYKTRFCLTITKGQGAYFLIKKKCKSILIVAEKKGKEGEEEGAERKQRKPAVEREFGSILNSFPSTSTPPRHSRVCPL